MGVAVVAILAALGTATYEIRESRAAEATLTTARRDYDALVARRRDLAQQAQTAEQDAARLRQAMADARAAQAAAAASQAAKAWDPVAEGKAFLARHPEVKQALYASGCAELNYRYSQLFKELGLTPAQIEKILAIKHGGRMTSCQLGPDLKRFVFPIGDINQLRNGPDGLREILGDDGYRKLVEFDRVEPARQLVAQLASALYFTEVPLTSAQSVQLTGILDGNRTPAGRSQTSTYDWDAVLMQAQGILSASQSVALDGLRVQEQVGRAAVGANVQIGLPPSAPKTANPPAP